jgi:mannose-6-phosphate isomerase-like protein (cupin superfamily)
MVSDFVGQVNGLPAPAFMNPLAEEVLYVASGEGQCRIGSHSYALGPGAAVFVPPRQVCQIENTGKETLRIVSSCCPEDPGRQTGLETLSRMANDVDTSVDAADTSVCATRVVIHENDREVIRAGADRQFRFLVHTDMGCRRVTQFVGWIPHSRAPFHHHTYEECIYILEGQGILHLEGQPAAAEFGAGSSIYLPDGVVHCLENPGPEAIRLLGVFYPSGSPGAAYEND